MHTINLTVNLSEQLLADILTTALEGGIGYWCVVDRVTRNAAHDIVSASNPQDTETDEPFDAAQFLPNYGPGYAQYSGALDLQLVARGLQRLADPALLALPSHAQPSSTIRASILAAITGAPEDADIDATDADVILQLGLFGQVIYG